MISNLVTTLLEIFSRLELISKKTSNQIKKPKII